jgi:2-oxoglutarate dehydrogenase E2 component (dihydrolipoamide succinyltransferase)
MQNIEVILPAMGEGITDATVTRWLVSVGDSVVEDQPLVEVATDKVDTEIPSPVAGVVKQLFFTEGQVPKVGETLLLISAESGQGLGAVVSKEVVEPKTLQGAKSKESFNDTTHEQHPTEVVVGIGLSPLVRSIIKREGIGTAELKSISGSGLGGRITRDDIFEYLERKAKVLETPVAPTNNSMPEKASSGIVEVMPMDRMRKLIAQHMVHSKQTSPHVTSFIEVDVTNMVDWRTRVKDSFQATEGVKLTLTPLFVEATVKAIKKHPLINSSVDGDNILLKRNINIGIAAALPNGNLIVPVVKDADKLSLPGLAHQVTDLAQRAKTNKLNPDEIQGGTFTITNLGMFDTLTGTPIINQPQVAILAIGAIVRRVVVLNSPMGETIGIRSIVVLSLSYDHRVVDGALAGNFIKSIRDIIESFKGLDY